MYLVKDKDFQRHLSEFKELQRSVIELAADLQGVKKGIQEITIKPTDHQARLEDLEIWRKRIHDVILDKTPTGRDKATKLGRQIGRRFGGGSKQYSQ